jgi:hypothetical protein
MTLVGSHGSCVVAVRASSLRGRRGIPQSVSMHAHAHGSRHAAQPMAHGGVESRCRHWHAHVAQAEALAPSTAPSTSAEPTSDHKGGCKVIYESAPPPGTRLGRASFGPGGKSAVPSRAAAAAEPGGGEEEAAVSDADMARKLGRGKAAAGAESSEQASAGKDAKRKKQRTG